MTNQKEQGSRVIYVRAFARKLQLEILKVGEVGPGGVHESPIFTPDTEATANYQVKTLVQ